MFDSCWKNFKGRFDTILERLARGAKFIDSEAQSFDIVEARTFRQRVVDDIQRREKERQDAQFRDVFAWLDLKGLEREQEDSLDARLSTRSDGTCLWLVEDDKVLDTISTWLSHENHRPFLWLWGKPGSGKLWNGTTKLLTDCSFRNRKDYSCFVSYSDVINTARVVFNPLFHISQFHAV